MKDLLTRVACILPICLSCLQAGPVNLADIARAPLWFAHADMAQLSAEDIDPGQGSVAHGEIIRHMAKLQKWANQSLGIETSDIHGITIFGTSASGDDVCFVLKGSFRDARMGEVLDKFPKDNRPIEKQYHLHRGLKWLGVDWCFTRLSDGEIVAANGLDALKKHLLDRGKKPVDWGFDNSTKREIAKASALVGFNMEAIHKELKLESVLSSNIRTVSLLANHTHEGKVSTQLLVQAKDADAMELIAPGINLLIELVRAYEEAGAKQTQGVARQTTNWNSAKIDITESRLSIRMQGSSDQMIKSLQSLEKLLPKQGR
ncbi:MAG: hypothetical protein AB8F34_12690 [Akkermansiaceae bacterium]